MRRRELSFGVPREKLCGHGVRDDIVRALLAAGRQVAVGEVVAGQALVAGDSGSFGNREKEAREPTHVDSLGTTPVTALTELLYGNST